MTTPISGPGGLPPDAVPPIQPIVPEQGVDNNKKEPPDPDEVATERELQRQKLLENFYQKRADDAEGRDEVDVRA